jgi:double-stranded uracil-DNA glycosylase
MMLPDVIRPGLRIVFCGTAAGARSAQVGAYYAGRGNQFWPTLAHVGLTSRRLAPGEYASLLDYEVGLTDLCKLAAGSDRQIGRDGFDVRRFVALIEANKPLVVAFNGKNAARIALGHGTGYGEQPESIGGARTFVLPSTSGAARKFWDIAPWRQAAAAVV